MNIVTWLRALLRRPAPTPSASAVPHALGSPSNQVPNHLAARPGAVPHAVDSPLTEAQRQARVERLLAKGAQPGSGVTVQLPGPLQRLLVLLVVMEEELASARANGWWAEESRLQLEIQQQRAELDYQVWQQALIKDHGPEVGRKLGQHQVEPGMTLTQLFASYGTPPDGAISYAADDPTHWFVQYGSEATGSYFELRDGVVTVARLGEPTLPAYVLSSSPTAD